MCHAMLTVPVTFPGTCVDNNAHWLYNECLVMFYVGETMHMLGKRRGLWGMQLYYHDIDAQVPELLLSVLDHDASYLNCYQP